MSRAGLVSVAMLAGFSGVGWAQGPPAYPSYQGQPYQSQPYQAPPYQAQPYQYQSQTYQYQSQPYQPPAAPAPAAQRLSPQELSNLVAPIALYPDMLLSEVLAASTYPLELVQAGQWMQGNPGLHGQALVDAAKQQNWDPSVQALVAFPEVMDLLTRDVQWTTDLGNAFLSQQADVMDAIQQLRASARANGRLTDTPQQRVVMDQDNGQSAIEIQPTDPQMVYPPVYNPDYVWGPPVYGAYPPLAYPAPGYGIVYAVGTFLGALFTGLLSFGGWGWGLSWLTHGLFLNTLFFSHFGFHGYGYGGYGYRGGYGNSARVAWVHDPSHRLGVAYGNRAVASRYGGAFNNGYGSRAGGSYREGYAGRSYFNSAVNTGRAGYYGSGYQAGNRQAEAYRGLTARESRGNSYGYGASRGNEYRGGGSGYSEYSSERGYAGARNYAGVSSQRSYGGGGYSAQHFSAPRSSGHFDGGGGHFGGSAHYNRSEHFSGGGHSGGGHSGGGGHSHGGGSHRK